MAPPPWDPSTGILDVLHLDSPRPGVVAMPVKPQQTLPGGPLVGLARVLGLDGRTTMVPMVARKNSPRLNLHACNFVKVDQTHTGIADLKFH